MKQINTLLKKNLLYIIGGILGGASGYAYWFFIGCNTGTCPITSSPYMSILWSITIGALLFGVFKKENSNKKV